MLGGSRRWRKQKELQLDSGSWRSSRLSRVPGEHRAALRWDDPLTAAMHP